MTTMVDFLSNMLEPESDPEQVKETSEPAEPPWCYYLHLQHPYQLPIT